MKTITDTITLALPAAAFPMDPERILFFDIETTGLSPRASSLYLIGTIHASGADQYTITQWFADTSASEQEMLTCFLEQLEHYDGLCHFNGRTFDIPYILNKCDKYHITPSSHCQDILSDTTQTRSFDMLLQLRPLKKLFGLAHGAQKDWEQFIGIDREDIYSGGDLIQVYSSYRQDLLLHPEQAAVKEHLLLLHNHDDLIGMLHLVKVLTYRLLLTRKKESPARIEHATLLERRPGCSTATISFELSTAVPRKVHVTAPIPWPKLFRDQPQKELELTLEHSLGLLTIPCVHEELKYFIPDYKNYYYLPEEDTAIHSSVAEFVDKAHRKAATAATCYVRKTGDFIPSVSGKIDCDGLLLFQQEHRDKLCFAALPEPASEDDGSSWLPAYVAAQLGCFL